MSRRLVLLLAVAFASESSGQVKVGGSAAGGRATPVTFAGTNPVSAPSNGPNFGVARIQGSFVNLGYPLPLRTLSMGSSFGSGHPSTILVNRGYPVPFGSADDGPNYAAAQFAGGPLNLGYPLPLGSPPVSPNFGAYGFTSGPCDFGYANPFGSGFCGQGFGCSLLPSRPWACGTLNCQRFPSSINSVFYAPWFDLAYGWAGAWGMANYSYGHPNFLNTGVVWSLSSDNGYHAPAPSRPQVIKFPTPLENGMAQIRIASPGTAEVLVNGKAIAAGNGERVFTTPVINGPTNYDVKVRQSINGKLDEQSFRVNAMPGGRHQLLVLR